MDWKEQAILLLAELVMGFILGRFFIPYFRRIKTGKFDFYLGDRFSKDGSEPQFGGVIIFVTAIIGISIGMIYANSVSAYTGNVPDFKAILCGVTFIFLLMCLGLFQDYIKDTGRGIGMKPRYLVISEFICCLGFLLLLRLFGFRRTEMLLPFRLGVWEMGILYYPLMAVFMTIVINLVKIHDCIGGETKNGVDGLCVLSTFIYSLGLLSGSSFDGIVSVSISSGKSESQLFAVCTVGACASFLFWTISPSKIYTGESGALLLGGLVCVMTEFSGLQCVFVPLGIVFIIDGICALVQRLVFKINKQIVFKGDTLHSHLKAKGWGDYKIMTCSTAVSIIGAVGAVAFFVYSGRLIY